MGIEDVIPKVQGVRLAVGRHELGRRRDVFPVRCVQLMQHPIPGHRVDGVLAGCAGGSDDRGRGKTAGADNIVIAATAVTGRV
jgi:hypothetical protein